MQVYLGNYNVPTDNDAAYNRQKQLIRDVIATYGTNNVAGVTVGNEYMLKCVPLKSRSKVFWLMSVSSYILQNGGGQANSPVGDRGAALLVPNIEDTHAMLKGMNLDRNIPVGNSDAGSYFNNKVLAAIDYGVSFFFHC